MSQGLYSAVSGVKTNQLRLNVISNNVANLNTVAFKESAVNFQTLFSSTISTGSRPTGALGGVNPKQMGNGVTIGEIKQNFAQGGSLFTGKQGDMQIEGEGFFTVLKSNASSSGTPEYYYTRAGNFSIDGDGYLVTVNGEQVMGTRTIDGDNAATILPVRLPSQLVIHKEYDAITNEVLETEIGVPNGPTATTLPNNGGVVTSTDVQIINFSVGADGAITATYSNGDRLTVRTDPNNTNQREVFLLPAEGGRFAEGVDPNIEGIVSILDSAILPEELQLRMANFPNPAGLIHQGSNNFSIGPNSGNPSFGVPTAGGRGKVTGGALESSNVDITTEFVNMVMSQRGLEAASKVITAQSEVLRTIINIV